MFDAATWAAELVWGHLVSVTSGAEPSNGVRAVLRPYKPASDKWDGCATKNYVGMAASFTPTWYQVFPGVDLSAPLTFSMGLSRQRGDDLRRQPGQLGNYSVGLGADMFQKYRFDLKYIDYFGRLQATTAPRSTRHQNGFTTC